MFQAKFKLNMRILAWFFMGGTCAILQEIMCCGSLIFGRLVFGKQYRPISDAADQLCGVWSGSTLFYWLF